uniref:Uncharacterized protein n=1 Tax=Anopheles atroparvus TaxID=41427 RepID=A0A182IZY5_ANOAO
MLHSPESWARVEEAATTMTRELQRLWTAERAVVVAEEMETARRRVVAREAARERWRTGRFGRDPTLRPRILAMDPVVQLEFRRKAQQLLGNIARLRHRERSLPPAVYAARMELRLALLRQHDAPPEDVEAAAARVEDARANLQSARREQRNSRERADRRRRRQQALAQPIAGEVGEVVPSGGPPNAQRPD